jgi:hypothetical protein
MNSLAYEKLPIPKNKLATNTHIQMTFKNLRMVINNNYWYHSTIIYMRQLNFGMQGLESESKGLETKPIEIWDLRLHDKVIKVWVCHITMKVKMTKKT